VIHVRPLALEDAPACDGIIASLPDWFGLQEGIDECAHAVRTQAGLVCERNDGVIGFLTVVRPSPAVAEISWLAVHADERNRGAGTALIERLIADLAGDARLLVVKTLSDREDPGPEYASTRAFYLAKGFRPAAELDLFGPENPIQLMSQQI
jgi:N-acetylglutamate synthase-like GNAT family acetyltransferase